jgi:hypothetical protein
MVTICTSLPASFRRRRCSTSSIASGPALLSCGNTLLDSWDLRQLQQFTCQREGAAFMVKRQGRATRRHMRAATAAPDQGRQARFQFFELKRFGQEIVRTDVQPAHPILQRALSGKHQHWRAVACLAHVGQQRQAMPVRQA